ncbi:MAG TPA: TIGR02266 family protein [bacterium]|nr:TIGR02266 family protein [bacterium]
MTYSGSERRQHLRMPISLQVRYRSLDTFFYDYAVNISHGGIFIKTRKPLARGAEVELEFEAPGAGKKFSTRGQVVRVIFPGEDEMEPAGMGIEFEPLSAEDRALIDRIWQKSAKSAQQTEPPSP